MKTCYELFAPEFMCIANIIGILAIIYLLFDKGKHMLTSFSAFGWLLTILIIDYFSIFKTVPIEQCGRIIKVW